MRPEDLELLLAAHAEGTLDAARAAEADALLRDDPAARETFDAYRTVDQALAAVSRADALPAVNWDRLKAIIADRLPAAVDAHALPVADAVHDRLLQLADGNLPASEVAAVEADLARRADLRLLLSDHQSLNAVLAAAGNEPLPAVRWDALSARISAAVADVALPSGATTHQKFASLRGARSADAGVLGRIGRWAGEPRRLAIAACLLIAAGVSFRLATQSGGPSDIKPNVNVAVVTTPAGPTPGVMVVATNVNSKPAIGSSDAASASADAVAEIQIGPPPGGFDPSTLAEGYRDDLGSRPGRSFVVGDRAAEGAVDNTARADDTGFSGIFAN